MQKYASETPRVLCDRQFSQAWCSMTLLKTISAVAVFLSGVSAADAQQTSPPGCNAKRRSNRVIGRRRCTSAMRRELRSFQRQQGKRNLCTEDRGPGPVRF